MKLTVLFKYTSRTGRTTFEKKEAYLLRTKCVQVNFFVHAGVERPKNSTREQLFLAMNPKVRALVPSPLFEP